jgi:hypothetical protein
MVPAFLYRVPIRDLLKALLSVLFINENFFRWARPHKGLRRGVLYVRRSRKPAENAVQRKKRPFMDGHYRVYSCGREAY